MNKNKVLNSILFISKFFCVLLILFMVILTIVLIHWHINPEFYARIPIQALNYQTLITFTSVHTSTPLEQDSVTYLPTIDKIGYLSMYFVYLQFIAIMLLILIATREFIGVINSVKRIQTFVSGNIDSFKKISLSFLLVFFISGFQIISFTHGIFYGWYVHVAPVIVALISYTLSEVFKEGNALLEENRTTI